MLWQAYIAQIGISKLGNQFRLKIKQSVRSCLLQLSDGWICGTQCAGDPDGWDTEPAEGALGGGGEHTLFFVWFFLCMITKYDFVLLENSYIDAPGAQEWGVDMQVKHTNEQADLPPDPQMKLNVWCS